MQPDSNRRILLVDDLPAIHEDFRKILVPDAGGRELAALEAALFGKSAPAAAGFLIDSAYQGHDALNQLEAAVASGKPYAMAFVDMLMPPGWDGVDTIERLWQVDARLQVVICTAFSDHAWTTVLARLDTRDRLLILKKPFDPIEVLQMAQALTAKWRLTAQAASQVQMLEQAVHQRTVDITRIHGDLEHSFAALQRSEERYRTLVEVSPDAILIEQDGRVAFANGGAARLFRAPTAEALLGRETSTLVSPIASSDLGFAWSDGEAAMQSPPIEGQARLVDSSTLDVAVTRQSFEYRGRPAVQMIARDISESKRLHLELKHLATHDALTGLPNRVLLMDRLAQALAHARRNAHQFMVAVIDLDRFKWVNDSFGHANGDRLLSAVAQRISEGLRKVDTLARVGGDEFVVVLHEVDDLDNGVQALRRIVASVAQPILLNDGIEATISCSVGCSSFPGDGQEADALLRAADAAMYQAKDSGRNALQIFNADLRSRSAERASLETDLRHAIERTEFTLHYQPQIDLRTGRLAAVEALLRWQHPRLGTILPGRFIPIAEACGLIVPIGEWVLQTACVQSRVWLDAGLAPIRVAVNMSAKQLSRPSFIDVVGRCLSQSRLDPALLELELTETASMEDPEQTIPLLHRLKSLGLGIAIDDFGTGYSNMQYLTRLPIDTLKLDGSFVRGITSDPGHLAIVEAIIAMAHRIELRVVAEMTETEGQVALLSSLGCDYAQGHYFARALEPEACVQLMRAGPMRLPCGAAHREDVRALLIVDDDVGFTTALERLLAADGFRVMVAHCAEDAFEMLAQHPVGVVISDQCMPGMSGVEFLGSVRRLYPTTTRLMLSGHGDFGSAVAAINDGAVHKFLEKPVGYRRLKEVLTQAFERGAALVE